MAGTIVPMVSRRVAASVSSSAARPTSPRATKRLGKRVEQAGLPPPVAQGEVEVEACPQRADGPGDLALAQLDQA